MVLRIAIAYLLLVSLFELVPSEDSTEAFYCDECVPPEDNSHRRCRLEDGVVFSKRIVSCPRKTCYLVLATDTNLRDNPSFIMGCTKDNDHRLDHEVAEAQPVYAPAPAHEFIPKRDQFVCRRNHGDMSGYPISISCFCYHSHCLSMIKNIADFRKFAFNLDTSLEGSLGWFMTNQTGFALGRSPDKKYNTGRELSRKQFNCGECPCPDADECPAIGRRKCLDYERSYLIETPCPAKQCYIVFDYVDDKYDNNGYEILFTGRQAASSKLSTINWMAVAEEAKKDFQYKKRREDLGVFKGCSSITEEELREHKVHQTRPPFYALPLPERTPGVHQWACRHNDNYDVNPDNSFFRDNDSGFIKYFPYPYACFCFTSNCQTGYDPDQLQFFRNVQQHLRIDYGGWIIVDAYGNITEPTGPVTSTTPLALDVPLTQDPATLKPSPTTEATWAPLGPFPGGPRQRPSTFLTINWTFDTLPPFPGGGTGHPPGETSEPMSTTLMTPGTEVETEVSENPDMEGARSDGCLVPWITTGALFVWIILWLSV